jgi:glutaredoxin
MEATVEVKCPFCKKEFETDVEIEPDYDDGWRD